MDPARRQEVRNRLEETGRRVVAAQLTRSPTLPAMPWSCRGKQGRFLAISARAVRSLTVVQRREIESVTPLLPLEIPTIELAGGSARCMLAGIHLAPRGNTLAAPVES